MVMLPSPTSSFLSCSLALLLSFFSFFFPKPSLLLSKAKFGLFSKWEEKERKMVFITCFLTSFQVLCLVLWLAMEGKQGEVFGWKENEESGFYDNLTSKLRCKPNFSQ